MTLNQKVVTTDYIKPAACALALGARLYDFDREGVDPCYSRLVRDADGDRVVTTFNFHEDTVDGAPVKNILAEYKNREFNNTISGDFPDRDALETFYLALKHRDHIHRKIKETFGHKNAPEGSVAVLCSKLAAALTLCGCQLTVTSLETKGRRVTLWFEPSEELDTLTEAWNAYPDRTLLPAGHKIYQAWEVLNCREALIDLSKKAVVMGEIEQNGNKFILPVSASEEQIKTTIKKLTK